MRPRSWEAVGLAKRRAAAVCAIFGALVAALSAAVTFPSTGRGALLVGLVVGCAACYVAATAPRRELEGSVLAQAREAPVLASSAAVYLDGTSSRSATLLMMRSEERLLSGALKEVRKRVLLGTDPATAVEAAGSGILSQSVSRLLRSAARSQQERLEEEGDEMDAMTSSYAMGEETKTPVFLAFSFFLPIMLLLFSAVSHVSDPAALVGLVLAEVIVLDIALSLSSSERRRLGA